MSDRIRGNNQRRETDLVRVCGEFEPEPGWRKVEAYSAGSRPSGIVNPKAIEAMQELAYDLSAHRSKSIVDLPDIEFDFVATLGCGDACPFVRAKRHADWDIPDSKALPPEEFRAVRDLIGSKVKTLLKTLA
jgi:arsenate reductase (thioredoxin)